METDIRRSKVACRHHSPRGLILLDNYETDYVSCLFDHLFFVVSCLNSVSYFSFWIQKTISICLCLWVLSDRSEKITLIVAASMPTCRGLDRRLLSSSCSVLYLPKRLCIKKKALYIVRKLNYADWILIDPTRCRSDRFVLV